MDPQPEIQHSFENPITPHRKINWLLVIIIIVGFFSVLTVGYFLGTSSSKSKAVEIAAEPTPTEYVIPTTAVEPTREAMVPDETAEWKTFFVKTINLQFKLPPSFAQYGDLKEVIYPGNKGTQLCVTYSVTNLGPCDVKYFGLGSLSPDYELGRGGSFLDVQGYTLENGKYFVIANLGRKYEIPKEFVKEITSLHGIKMIKINSVNYPTPTGEYAGPGPGIPNTGLGAIINSNNKTYAGVAIEMQLSDELTEETFDQIISTFKFTN